MKFFNKEDLQNLDKPFRTNLINSFLGVKPAILVGSVNLEGATNLAIFSQVFHVGANPALIGILFRPDTVQRHTLQNLRNTGVATLNLVPASLYRQAHWTSARFDRSEFEACGFTPEYIQNIKAPFVAQSPQKCAVQLAELSEIKANGTWLAIVAIELLIVDENLLEADGFLNFERGKLLSVCGLDAYFESKCMGRLKYAKPERLPDDLKNEN